MTTQATGPKGIAFAAAACLLLAVVLPAMFVMLGASDAAALPLLALLGLGLVLGIASRRTMLGRLAMGGSALLLLIAVVNWLVYTLAGAQAAPLAP